MEDPVLVVPNSEGRITKPYVAIIKDITETKDGSIILNGQWFYRPEDTETIYGENLPSSDARELFYSFHQDEVPAESIIHKCMVHFVPAHKHIPGRREYPGFIVRKVYDHNSKRLFKLTDKDHEDYVQQEIDLLVQKTMCRLRGLPDIKSGDHATDERCYSNASECYVMLAKFNAFTGNHYRDKWLEKLLEGIGYACDSNGGTESGGPTNRSQDKSPNTGTRSPALWPDGAVSAVIALEGASYQSLGSYPKYNRKMRQLCFNFKKNAQLAWRLLKRELEPSKILNMSPNELKEGLTVEEIASNKPEEDALVQMTDARCKRCTEKKVRLVQIISAGQTERYQLECFACGKTWYASTDEASTLAAIL